MIPLVPKTKLIKLSSKLFGFILLIPSLLGINQYALAQLSSEWAVNFGGIMSEYSYSIKNDANGNLLIAGYFNHEVDFDPSVNSNILISSGSADAFVCKLDPQGNLIWARSIGSTGDDRIHALALDANGNIYLCGYFNGAVDFNPHPTNDYILTSEGSGDIFILKLNNNGDFIWANSMGNTEMDLANDIKVTPTGTIYITGSFNLSVDFDPSSTASTNLLAANDPEFFLAKYDANGNFIWARDTEGTGYTKGTSIVIDNLENIYSIGHFSGNVDFDWNTTNSFQSTTAYAAVFILKHDVNGVLRWSNMFENGYREKYCLAIDNLGNIIAGGRFSIQTDLDPGSGFSVINSMGGEDFFVVKLNPLGSFIWGAQFGGSFTNTDIINSINTDASNNIYLTGSFEGTIDMNPGIAVNNLTSQGYADIYITKMDALGNFIWSEAFGGAGIDRGMDLLIDNSGNIYSTGYFSETVDFDPSAAINSLSVVGSRDIFVNKLNSATGITNNAEENVISVFPNPASEFLNVQSSEMATLSIHDVSGRIIFQSKVQATEFHLDLSNFTTGYFIIQLQTKTGVYSKPVILH